MTVEKDIVMICPFWLFHHLIHNISCYGFVLFTDKTYTTEEEELRRREVFRTNLKKIEMHNYLYNKGVKSYKLGINEYADMVRKSTTVCL